MLLKTLTVGMFGANCYLAGCEETRAAVVIDPGAEGKRILAEIKSLGITVKYIINTHGHIDHIGANARLRESLDAPILLHREDLEIYRNPGFGLHIVAGRKPVPDSFITDGDRISFGEKEITVIETPGHTRGSVCLKLGKAVFTGDTLFAGSIGRTDLAGGSFQKIMESIGNRLVTLPPDNVIYPGHGPASSIAAEIKTNPFVRRLL